MNLDMKVGEIIPKETFLNGCKVRKNCVGEIYITSLIMMEWKIKKLILNF